MLGIVVIAHHTASLSVGAVVVRRDLDSLALQLFFFETVWNQRKGIIVRGNIQNMELGQAFFRGN